MKKVLPFVLWLAVIVAVGAIYFNAQQKPAKINVNTGSEPGDLVSSGTVLVNVPWKHLPSIPNFQLTDQEGNPFDSAELAGQAYVVNFFFASCPTICRDFNQKVFELNKDLRDENIRFVSITVDPQTDTPEVLGRYAKDFDAEPDRWAFLTGQEYKIRELGEQAFQVVVDKATHSDNVLLVDRWGRYRDRFKWDDELDMKRFLQVARDVASETKPPIDGTIRTRNAMAGIELPDFKTIPWIREFRLTERSGERFFSKDMTGQVWIGSFFFSSCPGICKQQNEYLRGLQDRLENHPATIVSITTDPNHDTPSVLTQYANQLGADRQRWLFCGGNQLYTKRIGSEFFSAAASEDHHSSMLFLVDRWGNVRGEFDWQEPSDEVALLEMIDRLNAESVPPAKFERRKP